jgi:hypothetical protein
MLGTLPFETTHATDMNSGQSNSREADAMPASAANRPRDASEQRGGSMHPSDTSSPVISLITGGGALHRIGETFSPALHAGNGNFPVPIAWPHDRMASQADRSLGGRGSERLNVASSGVRICGPVPSGCIASLRASRSREHIFLL